MTLMLAVFARSQGNPTLAICCFHCSRQSQTVVATPLGALRWMARAPGDIRRPVVQPLL